MENIPYSKNKENLVHGQFLLNFIKNYKNPKMNFLKRCSINYYKIMNN